MYLLHLKGKRKREKDRNQSMHRHAFMHAYIPPHSLSKNRALLYNIDRDKLPRNNKEDLTGKVLVSRSIPFKVCGICSSSRTDESQTQYTHTHIHYDTDSKRPTGSMFAVIIEHETQCDMCITELITPIEVHRGDETSLNMDIQTVNYTSDHLVCTMIKVLVCKTKFHTISS